MVIEVRFYFRKFRGNEVYIYKGRRSQKVKVVSPFRGHTFKPFTLISKYFSGTVHDARVTLLPRIAYYQ
jgi:hypothetical protein